MRQLFHWQGRILPAMPLFKTWKIILPSLAALVLLCGCAHRYDVMLTNNMRITNVSKPMLDRSAGVYVFKDINGKERKIMASRVVEIDAHSRKSAAQFGQ
jgi:hypothetical protein